MSTATEYLKKAVDALVAERDTLDRQLEVISQALTTLERPVEPGSARPTEPASDSEPPMDVEPEPEMDVEPEPEPESEMGHAPQEPGE